MPSLCRMVVVSGVATAGVLATASTAQSANVPAQVVAIEGDMPAPLSSPMVDIQPPFVLANGVVGYLARLADGDVAVMQDTSVLWQSSDETGSTLSSFESTMGISGSGSFIYSPLVDGQESIWTDGGPLLIEGDIAPNTDGTTTIVDLDRPRMLPNSGYLFLADVDPSGGNTEVERILYRSFDGSAVNTIVALSTTTMVDGEALIPLVGLGVQYELSLNGAHHIHVLLADTGSLEDEQRLYVDGAFAASEATPTGEGDNWLSFDLVSINNAGNYLVAAETDAASASDVVLSYNAQIVVREGDTLAGIALTAPAQLRTVAINDKQWSAFVWNSTGIERAFFACDSADIAGSAQVVLSVGDTIDTDDDGVGDYTLTDFNATSTEITRPLSDNGYLLLDVDLDDGVSTRESIIRVPLSCCGNGELEPAEDCDDQNAVDTDDCLSSCEAASCGDGFLWEGNEDCDDGNADDTDDCTSSCSFAVCGDGFVWEGNELCDDGNALNDDACLDTCEPATCGDGFVHAGVEDCDDANEVDTDACLSDCVAASCGDGVVHEGVEDCDDQNDDDTDACVSGCVAASCGDGFVQAGVEDCDDGNEVDDDECANDCSINEPPDDTGETGADDSGDTTASTDDSSGSETGDDGEDSGSTTGAIFDGGDDSGCSCSADGGGRRSVFFSLGGLLWGLGRRRRLR